MNGNGESINPYSPRYEGGPSELVNDADILLNASELDPTEVANEKNAEAAAERAANKTESSSFDRSIEKAKLSTALQIDMRRHALEAGHSTLLSADDLLNLNIKPSA